jgi:hypothetical protein
MRKLKKINLKKDALRAWKQWNAIPVGSIVQDDFCSPDLRDGEKEFFTFLGCRFFIHKDQESPEGDIEEINSIEDFMEYDLPDNEILWFTFCSTEIMGGQQRHRVWFNGHLDGKGKKPHWEIVKNDSLFIIKELPKKSKKKC